jgi:DNA-binding transcriptional ArsR family regulator
MNHFSQNQTSRIMRRARALGDPTRLRILLLIARCERPVGQLASALSMQQSTVSRHLQVLFNAGLVNRRRDASAVIYSTNAGDLDRLLRMMSMGDRVQARIGSSRDPKGNRSARARSR